MVFSLAMYYYPLAEILLCHNIQMQIVRAESNNVARKRTQMLFEIRNCGGLSPFDSNAKKFDPNKLHTRDAGR